MYKRIILALSVLPVLLLSARVQAQAQPQGQVQAPAGASADQQAMMQQFQQIMQNMQAKGIDPREIFQQMQSGADPQDIQQMLIDKGVIDQQMITQMQGTAQHMTLSRIQDQLGATDEEWQALLPGIQKVISAQQAVGQRGMGGMMGGFFGGQRSNVSSAMRDLRAATNDPNSPPDLIQSKLGAWRAAYKNASDDLLAAQRDLVGLLTVRQEAVLSNMGLLP
jgi:hypothetical protein